MLMDIYVMDYDTLRRTKDHEYSDFYKSIPVCFKNRQYINMEVESIPREKEVLLLKRNGSIQAIHIYKVVYYERKIFVIGSNTESDIRPMADGSMGNVIKSGIGAFSSNKLQNLYDS